MILIEPFVGIRDNVASSFLIQDYSGTLWDD